MTTMKVINHRNMVIELMLPPLFEISCDLTPRPEDVAELDKTISDVKLYKDIEGKFCLCIYNPKHGFSMGQADTLRDVAYPSALFRIPRFTQFLKDHDATTGIYNYMVQKTPDTPLKMVASDFGVQVYSDIEPLYRSVIQIGASKRAFVVVFDMDDHISLITDLFTGCDKQIERIEINKAEISLDLATASTKEIVNAILLHQGFDIAEAGVEHTEYQAYLSKDDLSDEPAVAMQVKIHEKHVYDLKIYGDIIGEEFYPAVNENESDLKAIYYTSKSTYGIGYVMLKVNADGSYGFQESNKILQLLGDKPSRSNEYIYSLVRPFIDKILFKNGVDEPQSYLGIIKDEEVDHDYVTPLSFGNLYGEVLHEFTDLSGDVVKAVTQYGVLSFYKVVNNKNRVMELNYMSLNLAINALAFKGKMELSEKLVDLMVKHGYIATEAA